MREKKSASGERPSSIVDRISKLQSNWQQQQEKPVVQEAFNVARYETRTVRVPRQDHEMLDSFFAKAVVPFSDDQRLEQLTLSDLNSVSPGSPLLSQPRRAARNSGGGGGSRRRSRSNPVRRLAGRTDLVREEYTEERKMP